MMPEGKVRFCDIVTLETASEVWQPCKARHGTIATARKSRYKGPSSFSVQAWGDRFAHLNRASD